MTKPTLSGVLAFIGKQKTRVYPSSGYYEALDDVEVELRAVIERAESLIADYEDQRQKCEALGLETQMTIWITRKSNLRVLLGGKQESEEHPVEQREEQL